MLFSSIPFLYYFLPCVLFVYFLTPFRYKNFVLFLFSLIFYSWGEPGYIFLMVGSILLAYAAGLWIESVKKQRYRRWALVVSCLIHGSFLVYFKYADFLIESINALGTQIPLLKIALPIGISFYTFQILSYLIDVYRGDCEAQRNMISFGAYVSMFPQLIAGPIVRYRDIAEQLSTREHTVEKTAMGIRRFILGLAKKVILANGLGELCSIFQATSDPAVFYYWLYAFAFALQIYFDFSGYSDMAIGLGAVFGFHFPENFQYPYLARSIREFWRRWHMTLGSWFRDYIYIPLGGNRVKKSRWVWNIAVVWFLTGLWHGAAWNFGVWGLLFAVLLLIENGGFSKILERHRIFAHIYVILMVLISFVIFNAKDIEEAFYYLRIMFTGGGMPLVSSEFLYYLRSYGILLLTAVVSATPWIGEKLCMMRENKTWNRICNLLEPVVLAGLLLVVTAYLINDSYNPFLYFRF